MVICTNIDMQVFFRYANQITNGDEILVPHKYEVIPAKVSKVFNFIMQGNEWHY